MHSQAGAWEREKAGAWEREKIYCLDQSQLGADVVVAAVALTS